MSEFGGQGKLSYAQGDSGPVPLDSERRKGGVSVAVCADSVLHQTAPVALILAGHCAGKPLLRCHFRSKRENPKGPCVSVFWPWNLEVLASGDRSFAPKIMCVFASHWVPKGTRAHRQPLCVQGLAASWVPGNV